MNLKKIILSLFMLVITISITNAMSESCREKLKNGTAPLVVVMATDNGYAIPTAVSILSLDKTTPKMKKVIVLSNQLSDGNKSALEKLSSNNTKVVIQEIPDKYIERAKECSTEWNILVQLRLFYQELFNELNANQEFLNKLGLKEKINYFIHLDSDTVVIRDLSTIFEELNEDSCFASTDLYFLCPELLMSFYWDKFKLGEINLLNDDTEENTNNGSCSGGVVVWSLDNINNSGKKIIEQFKRIKNKPDYFNFFGNDIAYKMWKTLCDSTNRNSLVNLINNLKECSPEEIKAYRDRTEYKELAEGAQKEFCSFITSFFELSDMFGITSDNFKKIFEAFVYESNSEQAKVSIFPAGEGIEATKNNPTEEEVFNKFKLSMLPEKYNFVMKYVFPEIDNTPGKYFDTLNKIIIGVTSYEDAITQILKTKYCKKHTIKENFIDMVVMHFDVCYKPWSLEFFNLAQEIPELKIIIQIYGSYITQLLGFDGIDEWKEKFALQNANDLLDATSIQGLLSKINPCRVFEKHDIHCVIN